jgi:hypothetical protein
MAKPSMCCRRDTFSIVDTYVRRLTGIDVGGGGIVKFSVKEGQEFDIYPVVAAVDAEANSGTDYAMSLMRGLRTELTGESWGFLGVRPFGKPPIDVKALVKELATRLELVTCCLQDSCATDCATPARRLPPLVGGPLAAEDEARIMPPHLLVCAL